ncbi:MAG: hypothetical protein LC631_05735 [Desulfovibrionales bacterium]|nr:hypothetical protein [Desulfovibrionales bacterium]
MHLASVMAVSIYFRNDLLKVFAGFLSYPLSRTMHNKIQFNFGCYILIATLITGLLGILLKDCIGQYLKTPEFISLALIITGLFLIIIERMRSYGRREVDSMNLLDAIIVGLGQSIAILPGISRSGSTLVAALWRGLSKDTAVSYSFLLAIPIILGSSVLMLDDINRDMWSEIGITALITSFIFTFIFSWIGIMWLISFLKKTRLIYFALYCFTLALFVYLFVDPAVTF